MAPPILYLDEDVYHGVAVGLRRRGFDVVTTAEGGNLGATDAEQLRFAVAQQRCLFTFNRGDFALRHAEMLSAGEHHHGVILSAQRPIGVIVRALSKLLSTYTARDLRDLLVWIRHD